MTQRIINDTFWTDPYVEDLDPSEKLIFLYLLSNPLCNIAGCYEIKRKRIAYETGFDKDMVDKILERFEKDSKILVSSDWIILKNFAKNQSSNPNVKTGMQRIINSIPETIVKGFKGFERLPHFTLLNLTIPNSTIPNSDEDENTHKEIKSKTRQLEDAFDRFWELYPKKVNRKKTEQRFMNLSFQVLDNLFAGLEEYVKKWRVEQTEKKYIPSPDVWLNNERWCDEIITEEPPVSKTQRLSEKQMEKTRIENQKQSEESDKIQTEKKQFADYWTGLSPDIQSQIRLQALENARKRKPDWSVEQLKGTFGKPLIQAELGKLIREGLNTNI